MSDHAAPTRVNSTGGASSLRRRVPSSSRSEALSLGNDTHAPQTQAVKITPWRFFNTIVILALGIYKAVATYHGQTTAPTTTDWITGVVWTLIGYWIGFVEQDNPEAWFFGHDLAPSLGFLLILVVGLSLFIMMYAVLFALANLINNSFNNRCAALVAKLLQGICGPSLFSNFRAPLDVMNVQSLARKLFKSNNRQWVSRRFLHLEDWEPTIWTVIALWVPMMALAWDRLSIYIAREGGPVSAPLIERIVQALLGGLDCAITIVVLPVTLAYVVTGLTKIGYQLVKARVASPAR